MSCNNGGRREVGIWVGEWGLSTVLERMVKCWLVGICGVVGPYYDESGG